MPAHRYQIGQEVRFQPVRHQAGSPHEPYVVVRLLPEENGSPLYHITEKTTGLQRIVPEGQLVPPDPRATLPNEPGMDT